MGASKVYYSEEVRIFMRTNNRPFTQYDIAEVFGGAYLKVQSGSNAKKGFEATGLYPVRRNVFDESDFIASEQEELLNEPENEPAQELLEYVSPKQIMPFPFIQKKKGAKGRPPGKAKVITSSPYVKELETSLNIAKEKLNKATRKIQPDKDEKRH